MHQNWHLAVLYFLGLQLSKVSSACTDQHASCAFWAGISECVLNPGYMSCTCSLSCDTNSECTGDADTSCECPVKAARGLCEHGSLTASCPHTCSRRQNITCAPPPGFPNAVAIGNRRFLDRVTYICRHGYRNNGNVGLRACTEAGTWAVSTEVEGQTPNCVADSSLNIPCEEMTFKFTQVFRTTAKNVGILDSVQGYSVVECVTWCQRVPGCTHVAYVTGKCLLYYNIARIQAFIDEGDVWERKYLVEPVYYYN